MPYKIGLVRLRVHHASVGELSKVILALHMVTCNWELSKRNTSLLPFW